MGRVAEAAVLEVAAGAVADPVQGPGPDGTGDEPAEADQPAQHGSELNPLPASGRETDELPNDPENRAEPSSQVVEDQGIAVAAQLSGSGRTNRVSSGAQARPDGPSRPEAEAAGGLAGSEGARTSAQYCVAQAGRPAVAGSGSQAAPGVTTGPGNGCRDETAKVSGCSPGPAMGFDEPPFGALPGLAPVTCHPPS